MMSAAGSAQKKPYSPPRLVVYGDIRELTRNSQKNVNKDGGNNSFKT